MGSEDDHADGMSSTPRELGLWSVCSGHTLSTRDTRNTLKKNFSWQFTSIGPNSLNLARKSLVIPPHPYCLQRLWELHQVHYYLSCQCLHCNGPQWVVQGTALWSVLPSCWRPTSAGSWLLSRSQWGKPLRRVHHNLASSGIESESPGVSAAPWIEKEEKVSEVTSACPDYLQLF